MLQLKDSGNRRQDITIRAARRGLKVALGAERAHSYVVMEIGDWGGLHDQGGRRTPRTLPAASRAMTSRTQGTLHERASQSWGVRDGGRQYQSFDTHEAVFHPFCL